MNEKQEEAIRIIEAIGTTSIGSDNVLSPIVLEAIQNDTQINALHKRLNDLVQYQLPKYVLKSNGEFEAVHSEEYNRLFAKIVEQIEHRQSQILSAYNWR